MAEKVTKNLITPDLSALLDSRIKNGMADLNCTLIGTIESFDATTQTATISVNYKRRIKNLIRKDDNKVEDAFVEYPILLDCPVVILSGGGGYLTFPITTGDTCMVLFCDRDIDAWFDSGQILAPNSDRIHNLSDGIALVGIRSKLNFLSSYNEIKASLIDATGERLFQSGDTKYSYRTANHSGWLILDGSTIGDVGSGADYEGEEYEELFDILKSAYPNAGTEVFGTNVVILPDERGRGSVAADNMGGSQANVLTSANQANRNVLGGEIGAEQHQLTIAELAAHTHLYRKPNANEPQSSGSNDSGIDHASNQQTGSTGGDDPHNNVPPGSIKYAFIKI